MKLGIFGRHNYKVMIYLLIILILGMLFYGNYSLIEGNGGNPENQENQVEYNCNKINKATQEGLNTTNSTSSQKYSGVGYNTGQALSNACSQNQNLIS